MKKVISLALALLLALPLAGCSGSKPDTVVTTFCSAVQAFDFEKAATCMENGSEDLEDPYDDAEMEEDLSSEQVMTYLKECASKMTYKIGESKVDGESATVPVSFTYVDAGPVITSALGEYITQAFKSDAKKKYFHRQYYAFLDKARELTGISLEAFCAETPYDIGMAMYKLNEAYQDKFSFYIYYRDELKTLDEWIRETDLSGSFYFGGTLDYHF